MRYISISFIFLLSLAAIASAQVSSGGVPPSFSNSLSSNIDELTLPPLDVATLLAEDALEADGQTPPRFGYAFPVDIGLETGGSWEQLPDGGRVWRLEIISHGAYSINLIYNDFWLPRGASFFVYSADREDVIGAFTAANNKAHGQFSTAPVQGDHVILEYHEPPQSERGRLNISKVVHAYRDLFGILGYGDSEDCHNNVNCPEGNPWQDQKRAVAMILVNGDRICTGSLLNNTAQDGTPYFVTASHCLDGDEDGVPEDSSAVGTWTFMFNYESPTCQNEDGPTHQTISGADFLVWTHVERSSDMTLLRLNETPPDSYNVYYAGWNRADSPASSSAGIHHPQGDIKKISFENDPVVSSQWNLTPDSHWEVVWNDGVTAPGSSGSPLYDQNHRFVGVLTGGGSECDDMGAPDFYGKLALTWTETNINQYLDPNNSGVTTLDGTNGVQSQQIILSGNITSDMTLYSYNTYLLSGPVYVDNGVTLTIEPGTVIYGEQSSNGSLIISQGGQLIAAGTVNQPIIFTSDQADRSPNPGDWGGLVIHGYAPVNSGSTVWGPFGTYGGGEPGDNSGVLRYVRIEYAGRNDQKGISFMGVGNGTTVEYLQIHASGDDGVDLTGGTVNIKYLIATQNEDDSIDYDEGWRGKGQFWIVQQNGNRADRGLEGENNCDSHYAEPLANPTLYNITLIGDPDGPDGGTGILLKCGTAGVFRNALVLGFEGSGLDIDDYSTHVLAENGDLSVQNSIFYDNDPANFNQDNDAFDESGWALTPDFHNLESATNPVENPYDLNAPDFRSTGIALTHPYELPPNDGFFEPANFVGGMGPYLEWTAGWTELPVHEIQIPDIAVNPNQFDVTVMIGNTRDVTMLIENQGNVDLTYSITDTAAIGIDATWLTYTPEQGTVAPGERDTITVTFDARGLPENTYLAHISIAHNDPLEQNPFQIPVSMNIVSQTYCSVESDDASFEYITNVTFAEINQSSGSSTYSDFTDHTATVTRGEDETLSVTIEAESGDHITAFIDWNQDFDFDDNNEEFIVVGSPGTGQPGPHTISVNVPAQAELGTTRMRVMLEYGQSPQPCINPQFGEVEDYSVTVIEPVGTPDLILDRTRFTPTVNEGASTTQTLTISNEGTADLIISITDEVVTRQILATQKQQVQKNVREDATWLTYDVENDTIPSGNEQVVTLTFDAANLSPGTYNANLLIDHNDPDEDDPAIVAVEMTVNSLGEAVHFQVGSVSGSVGNEILVPVIVSNFEDVVSIQFSMHWSSLVAAYAGVEQFSLNGLNESNFGTTDADNGNLTFLWYDPAGTGQTEPDGTTIFAIRLSLNGDPGDTTSLFIDGNPLSIQVARVIEGNPQAVDVEVQAGLITTLTTVDISGTVRHYNQNAVADVNLDLTGDDTQSTTSANDGAYQFTVDAGGNYTITPTKEDDAPPANGMNALDLAMIQRHLLGIQQLDSPYKIIAADVDEDNNPSALDMVFIKRFLLAIVDSIPGGLWTFVDSDFTFSDPTDPFPYDTDRSYSNVTVDMANQDFIAVKKGDVNGEWTPTTLASTERLAYSESQPRGQSVSFMANTEDMQRMADHQIRVPITVTGFNDIGGFQFTLNWDAGVLEFAGLTGFGLSGLDMDDFGTMQRGALTALWIDEQAGHQTLADGTTLFEVIFDVKKKTETTISFSSSITEMFAHNGKTLIPVELVGKDGWMDLTQVVPAKFALLANYPNPFNPLTTITYTLPQAQEVTLSVYNLSGQLIKQLVTTEIQSAGSYSVQWDGTDQWGNGVNSGMYLYRLDTTAFSQTRRMILLK